MPDVIDIAITRDFTFPLEMYFLHEGASAQNPTILNLGEEEREHTPK